MSTWDRVALVNHMFTRYSIQYVQVQGRCTRCVHATDAHNILVAGLVVGTIDRYFLRNYSQNTCCPRSFTAAAANRRCHFETLLQLQLATRLITLELLNFELTGSTYAIICFGIIPTQQLLWSNGLNFLTASIIKADEVCRSLQ